MKKKFSLLSLTILMALISSCAPGSSSSSDSSPSDPSSDSGSSGDVSSSDSPSPSSESSSSEPASSSERTSSSEPASSSKPASSSEHTSSSQPVSSETTSTSSADVPTIPYYSSIDWTLTGAALKSELADLIYDHHEIGYDGLKTAYETTDVDVDENGDEYMVDMYSDIKWPPYWDYHNYSKEGDTWNREHIVPQNTFGSGLPRSDIFNVYPTDGYVNGRRGNNPHGQVGSATYTSGNGSKLGSSSLSGYSGTVFEPIDRWKGDIARSYFYTVTCYESLVPSWKNNGQFALNTYPSLASWTVELFLQWHDQDPVDEWERGRNERCYSVQDNRNPFIDYPEAAHLIWDSAY